MSERVRSGGKITDDAPSPDKAKKDPSAPKTAEPDRLAEFYRALGALSPEDRAHLGLVGMAVPEYDNPSDQGMVWGVVCHVCSRIALELVGQKFRDIHGRVIEMPQPVQLSAIPWTQSKRAPDKINRARPECQHCRAAIHAPGGFVGSGKKMVQIRLWKDSRDRAFRESQKLRRRGPDYGQVVNPDGTPVDLSDAKGPDPIPRGQDDTRLVDASVALGRLAFPATGGR